jgi:hypothetical protein
VPGAHLTCRVRLRQPHPLPEQFLIGFGQIIMGHSMLLGQMPLPGASASCSEVFPRYPGEGVRCEGEFPRRLGECKFSSGDCKFSSGDRKFSSGEFPQCSGEGDFGKKRRKLKGEFKPLAPWLQETRGGKCSMKTEAFCSSSPVRGSILIPNLELRCARRVSGGGISQ